ncbi:N-acetylmuramoyl-L-alanine amidase [Desulfovibrio inopinatus]|uniref:N-acetylmuramoyl-L-alanine amidase n=1 Tax=Desulfovibrio inopinatus TaxID=102109 RepID=UPI00041BA332|nr:N-acetylmuramoyl-L-alanine amidase [Desulfovibrio inopinatus]
MMNLRRRHLLAVLATALGSGVISPRLLFAVTGNILGFQSSKEDKKKHDANAKNIATLKQAVAQNQRDFRAWSLLGQAYVAAGDTTQALVAYRQALRLNPNDARVRMMAEMLSLYSDGQNTTTAPAISTLQRQAEAERQAAKERLTSRRSDQQARRYRIVVDPGHGGPDTGCVGKKGLQEKDVCLDIALRVARALSSTTFDVFLTRTADFHLTFFQRALLASLYQADVFVSIHASAIANPQGRGLWAFSYDTAGRTEMDRQTAKQENKSWKYDLGKKMAKPTSLSDIESFLQAPLTCLSGRIGMGTTTLKESFFAHVPQGLPFDEQGRGAGPFQMLKPLPMTALVLECGFVGNNSDEQILMRADKRNAVAEGVAAGIVGALTGKRKS